MAIWQSGIPAYNGPETKRANLHRRRKLGGCKYDHMWFRIEDAAKILNISVAELEILVNNGHCKFGWKKKERVIYQISLEACANQLGIDITNDLLAFYASSPPIVQECPFFRYEIQGEPAFQIINEIAELGIEARATPNLEVNIEGEWQPCALSSGHSHDSYLTPDPFYVNLPFSKKPFFAVQWASISAVLNTARSWELAKSNLLFWRPYHYVEFKHLANTDAVVAISPYFQEYSRLVQRA